MLKNRAFSGTSVGILALLGLPCLTLANVFTLNRDSVVSVVFDTALTVSDSRPGDHFTCHVDNDRDLPPGTVFEGRVLSIHAPRGDRPPSMDLEFTAIDLPNGSFVRIRAVPIPLDRDLLRTDRDGRVYVKNDVRKQGEYVVGGALGGYLLGSIFHRRITGLFLGTVAGMIAADADRSRSMNVVIDRNTKMGALFNQDVTIDMAGRGSGTWNRGWDGVHQTTSPSNSGSGWDARPADSTPPPPVAATPSRGQGSWDGHHHDGNSTPAGASGTQSANPAEREIAIRFGDQSVAFEGEAKPYYEGETVMVPVEKTAAMLGLDCEHGAKNSLYIENPDSSLKLEQDSASYRLNGKRATMSHPAVLKAGILYAPVTVFAYIAAKDIYVNGAKLDSKG